MLHATHEFTIRFTVWGLGVLFYKCSAYPGCVAEALDGSFHEPEVGSLLQDLLHDEGPLGQAADVAVEVGQVAHGWCRLVAFEAPSSLDRSCSTELHGII